MGAFVQELFQFGLYKRSQGRVVRQVTFAALAIIVAFGCYTLSNELLDASPAVRYGVPSAVLALGLWAVFRLVQLPAFADFLISVEAEMKKVAWPKRRELINASIVVIVVIFVLAGLLVGFDLVLQGLKQLYNSLIDSIAGGGGGEPPVTPGAG